MTGVHRTLAIALIAASSLLAQVGAGAGPRTGSIADDLGVAMRDGGAARKEAGSAKPVSVDILRHPLKEKVRGMLRKALDAMNAERHAAAIEQLEATLAKYPESAPYTQSFLGVEYIRTERYQEAVNSFAQAAELLPHDAMTHYNFGLSLACAGDYDRAEQETRRALELDPKIESAQTLLSLLLQRKHS